MGPGYFILRIHFFIFNKPQNSFYNNYKLWLVIKVLQ